MSYLKNEDFQVQVSLPFLAKIIYYFVIIFFFNRNFKVFKIFAHTGQQCASMIIFVLNKDFYINFCVLNTLYM